MVGFLVTKDLRGPSAWLVILFPVGGQLGTPFIVPAHPLRETLQHIASQTTTICKSSTAICDGNFELPSCRLAEVPRVGGVCEWATGGYGIRSAVTLSSNIDPSKISDGLPAGYR